MIRFIKNIILLTILIIVGYIFRVQIKEQFIPAWQGFFARVFQGPACSKPIAYTLGTFDAQFGISQKYFLAALTEAEAIWEKPYGKNLFEYKENSTSFGVVKVNLVYDYRQQTTSKLKEVGGALKTTRADYDQLKYTFITMQAQYDAGKSALAVAVSAFNKRNAEHQRQVEYWNAKGGAPKAEYDKLQAEQIALQTESRTLQAEQSRLNGLVDAINITVTELNALAKALNITVGTYNTIGASRGESFEEGIYHSDGSIKEIDVYEFNNHDKLVRLLAHELGHAIGLDHVPDKEAIMYELNAGKKLAATAADLSALKVQCEGVKEKTN